MYVGNPSAWGTKRICPECKAKYYDLRHIPAVCPKCQTKFVEPPPKARFGSGKATGTASRGRPRAATSGHAGAWQSGGQPAVAELRPSTVGGAKVPDDGDVDSEDARDEATEEDEATEGNRETDQSR